MALKVYLIGRSQFDVESFLTFLRKQATDWRRTGGATAPEELVEAAGRICYMSFGGQQSAKTNAEYVAHLIDMGHESVLEHVHWTFLLEGVSRAFTHQLVRHRVGFAFSQLSQQYHEETQATFVEPAQLQHFPKASATWHNVMEASREAYRQILKEVQDSDDALGLTDQKRENLRAIRSIARSVLPNATETKIVVTANARAWRHFLHVRGSIAGDIEMRSVSAELLRLLQREAPSLFFDFTIGTLADGAPTVLHAKKPSAHP